MRRGLIEFENRLMIKRQRDFRAAADVVADAWMRFDEVAAIAVIGSVAGKLWQEVPRFREFRRAGVEIWHECKDLDLALWLDSQARLGELRRAAAVPLQRAYDAGRNPGGVVSQQVDTFLFEPGTDGYPGRLCKFATCPKDKPPCWVEGCGAIPFNRVFEDFRPYADILAPATHATLYRHCEGRLRSALDLPATD